MLLFNSFGNYRGNNQVQVHGCPYADDCCNACYYISK